MVGNDLPASVYLGVRGIKVAGEGAQKHNSPLAHFVVARLVCHILLVQVPLKQLQHGLELALAMSIHQSSTCITLLLFALQGLGTDVPSWGRA
jgi:hypothetical protein